MACKPLSSLLVGAFLLVRFGGLAVNNGLSNKGVAAPDADAAPKAAPISVPLNEAFVLFLLLPPFLFTSFRRFWA